jgi:hypothetical protein
VRWLGLLLALAACKPQPQPQTEPAERVPTPGDRSCTQDSDCTPNGSCTHCRQCFRVHPVLTVDCKAVCFLDGIDVGCSCKEGVCQTEREVKR